MNDIESIRSHLTSLRDDLTSRLQRIRSDVQRRSGPLSADLDDQAAELENAEVLDELDDATRIELEAVNAALARIDQGTYGICVDCEEPIPAGRLQAMPYATRCVRCASEAERQP